MLIRALADIRAFRWAIADEADAPDAKFHVSSVEKRKKEGIEHRSVME